MGILNHCGVYDDFNIVPLLPKKKAPSKEVYFIHFTPYNWLKFWTIACISSITQVFTNVFSGDQHTKPQDTLIKTLCSKSDQYLQEGTQNQTHPPTLGERPATPA